MKASPALPPEGWSIGSYRMERSLGHGGMGEVFLAWDERLERRVAIKRVRQGSGIDRQSETLRREARVAARLNHPAVIHVRHVAGHLCRWHPPSSCSRSYSPQCGVSVRLPLHPPGVPTSAGRAKTEKQL